MRFFVKPSNLNRTIFGLVCLQNHLKCIANANAAAQAKMMNTKITLDKKEVRRFVGDFSKRFKDLEEWTSNAVQIESWKEHFLEKYPNIFNVSTENEVEMETTMETESRPIVDGEEILRKVEEKLLSNKTKERFTNYDGVID